MPIEILDKHVGEMSAEETKLLVDPNQRIINQVTVNNVQEADDLFEILMSESVSLRKKFLQEHSAEATYQY